MLPIAQQFYLSKAISLAIADFIALFTDNVSIKWPNDIYVGNGKIAGVLIENSIEGEIIKRSIIGIGININQEKFSGNVPNPLSLKQLTNNEYDLDEMLDLLSSLIANRYLLIKSNEFGMIDENYHQVLYRIHQVSNYIADGELFRGTITGVEPNGALIIQDENKIIHKFLHKEVEYVL
jgi:BirA family biotin operon repressor/biotin-[acetyl-CoA-carboxylase] ligase